MTYYNTRETLTGGLRDLAAEKLEASETDIIEIASFTQSTGYCETCYDEWDAFALLLNGEAVYTSSYDNSPFAAFQYWLTEK